mmetsp:Transcript_17524/g.50142  ORF Transcript_17524/g.50142 Transcript_17524/m.50142 type:complete len:191 (-) Transcript_17524:2-574(-)
MLSWMRQAQDSSCRLVGCAPSVSRLVRSAWTSRCKKVLFFLERLESSRVTPPPLAFPGTMLDGKATEAVVEPFLSCIIPSPPFERVTVVAAVAVLDRIAAVRFEASADAAPTAPFFLATTTDEHKGACSGDGDNTVSVTLLDEQQAIRSTIVHSFTHGRSQVPGGGLTIRHRRPGRRRKGLALFYLLSQI